MTHLDRTRESPKHHPAPARLGAFWLVALCLPVLIVVPGLSLAALERRPPEGAEIRDLHVENRPHDLLASFSLHGAFSPEIREQIESGLPVTFNHYVEINRRRPGWIDSTVVKKVISVTVLYDTLTQQYRLSRKMDGEVVETAVTEKTQEMERFMTSVDKVPLCDPSNLPGNRPLYLRVKSRVQKRFVFFFIPWNFETAWARVGLQVSRAGDPGGPHSSP